MTSKQIECFLTVVKTLNFTEAAQQLYSSQPSISRNISLMEEELGYRLFDRGNNYVTLTQAGAIMAGAFQEMDEIFKRQHKMASYLSQGVSGKITLGFHTNMNISRFCLDRLDRFREIYPYVVIDLVCHSTSEFNRLFAQGRIDAAITHDFNRPKLTGAHTVSFYETRMFLLYGKRHPNYGKQGLSLKDFASSRFYCPEECDSTEFQDMMERLIRFYHVAPWKPQTAGSIETILMNVRFGNGVTFMDDVVLQSVGEDMAVLALDESVSLVKINITWDRKNQNPMLPLLLDQFLPATGK